MRRLAALMCFIVPTACAGAVIEDMAVDAVPPACTIEIEFMSRCCGVDRDALERVARYIERSAAVSRAFSRRWGAQGEVTLCLVVENAGRARAVFEDLTIIVPARGRKLPRLKPPPPVVLRLDSR